MELSGQQHPYPSQKDLTKSFIPYGSLVGDGPKSEPLPSLKGSELWAPVLKVV